MREVLEKFAGVLDAQKQRIEELGSQVEEFGAKADLNSRNSSKSLSSDSTAQRVARRERDKSRKRGSDKGRGTQPGHDSSNSRRAEERRQTGLVAC